MTHEAGLQLDRLIRSIAEDAGRVAQQAIADGTVEAVEGQYASVRLGANDAPTPGFYFPPSLDVQLGDHVLVVRPKGYQLILWVLQRNALSIVGTEALPDHEHTLTGDGGSELAPRVLRFGGLADLELDADTEDWDLGDITLVRFTPLDDYDIGGIVAVPGGIKVLMNASTTKTGRLLNESAGSLGGNRLALGTNRAVPPYGLVVLVYDDIALRWRALGTSSGSGTAFPASPGTGDRFYRTDRGIDYEYDGTRWLSVQVYYSTMTQTGGFAATTTQDIGMIYPEVYDKWLVRADLAFQVVTGGTALGASHKWVVDIVKSGTGGAEQSMAVSFAIDSGASNVWRVATPVVIGGLLGSYSVFRAVLTKTGTPGNLRPTPSVVYRLVG